MIGKTARLIDALPRATPNRFAIDVDVLRRRSLPRKDLTHRTPAQTGDIVGAVIPRAQSPTYRIVESPGRLIVVFEARPCVIVFVEILDRIVEPPHGVDDGQTTIAQAIELIEPTRLENAQADCYSPDNKQISQGILPPSR